MNNVECVVVSFKPLDWLRDSRKEKELHRIVVYHFQYHHIDVNSFGENDKIQTVQPSSSTGWSNRKER